VRLQGFRWLRDELPFTVVALVLVVSVLYLVVEPGHWGRSSGGVAVALLLAGVFRAVLPSRYAGLLTVRGRVADSVTCLVLGTAILVMVVRLHG
jgi:hypothetical protein